MRARLANTVIDQSGNKVAGATVNVYEYGTTTPVAETLYDAARGGGTLSNPLTTNGSGAFEAWINGRGKPVTVRVSGGTLASPVTWNDNFDRDTSGDLVSVQSFGAVADGTTDCTAAIQAAIDAGGTVLFPLETGDVGYKITSTLFVGDGTATAQSTLQSVRLMGTGSKVAAAADPTVTKVESTLDGYVPLLWYGAAGERMLEVRGPIQNVTIEHLGFDCRLIASTGIRTYDMQNSKIRWCKVLNNTNNVSASGLQRTDTAAFDFRAYSVGDASPNSHLSSDNGGNSCTFEGLVMVSIFGTRPAGFAVGSQDAPAPDGTNASWPTNQGGSPDISQCLFVNCYTRTANQAGSVGLALRYVDSISFEQCSFPALIPVSVEVAPSATAGNGLQAFPNYIGMKHVHVDNGRSSPNGSWNDCRVIGTWTAEHKILFEPAVNGLDGLYGVNLATFGYGWTAHDSGSDYSGWIGKLHVSSDFKSGGDIQAVGSVTAVGGSVTGATGVVATTNGVQAVAGDVTATAGNVKAGTRVYIDTVRTGGSFYQTVLWFAGLDNTGTLIDLGTRFGTLEIINGSTGQQAEFYLNGAIHTVTQKSSTITGFATTDSGTGIAVYWDGVSAYKIKNRSATNPTSLRVFFRGTDS